MTDELTPEMAYKERFWEAYADQQDTDLVICEALAELCWQMKQLNMNLGGLKSAATYGRSGWMRR
jgi:hypothetical protein